MSSDFCQDLVSTLQTGTGTKVTAIRDLLAFGADSIYESGDLTATGLNDAEQQRRDDENLETALFLVIQDAGESRIRDTDVFAQTIVARIIDRLSGYHNIRAARLALLAYLRDPYAADLSTGYGEIELEYLGRSGHQYDRAAGVEFEALTFRVYVDHPEDK